MKISEQSEKIHHNSAFCTLHSALCTINPHSIIIN